ncbi:MAG TPA: hypothetical protein VGP47_06920 [Parachlamydiaceae bacterium]|nr:hypothetical protein [Parachlamydiaceae bacterium]
MCGALVSPWLSLDGAWQPETTVSEPPYVANISQNNALGVNFQGNAVAVWESNDTPISTESAIVGSFYTRGVGWGPNMLISSLETYAPNRYVYTEQTDPDVDLNSSNYAVAVWSGSYNRDPFFLESIFASRMQPDGTWGAVEVISQLQEENFTRSINPSVQVNEAGTALAVWRESPGDDTWRTVVSFLPFGGTWTAPYFVSVPEVDSDETDPRSALNDRGDAVVAWKRRQAAGVRSIDVATYNAATATWDAPVSLDTTFGDNFTQPVVSIDENGNSIAIWANDETLEVKSSYRPFGGVWEPAVIIASNYRTEEPYIIMDRFGNATAVWNGLEGSVYSASRPFGGVWGVPVAISQGVNDYFESFQIQDPLAVDLAGNAMAVWFGNEGILYSAFKPFGQAWQAPEQVSTSGDNSVANVGLAECGFAIATWEAGVGENPNDPTAEVRAAVHENLFPLIAAGSAQMTQCKLKFATQSRVISNLTWGSLYPGCVAAFNIYCNGTLISTITDGSFGFTVSDCDDSCRFTVTAVNFQGFETAPIPFVMNASL